MPYFVYRTENRPIRQLRKLESFETFGQASGYAKAARIGLDPDLRIRVIFAENELQAEDLLSTARKAPVTGDDD